MAEVQYLVLPNSRNPYLLARVRWPDVAQAISAGHPEWQEDPGLFDLPYDPSSVTVTPAEAVSIAARWGVHELSGTMESASSLIRRMPANWSNLVPAEKRAWSLELVTRRRVSASRVGRSRSLRRTLIGSTGRFELEPGGQLPGLLATTGNGSAPSEGRYLAARQVSRQTMVAAERRHHARVRVDGRALIKCRGKTIFANLVNLSQGGVHLLVPDAQSAFESGDKLDPPFLFVDAVSKCQISLDVSASVAWRRDIGPGTQLGVVFADLDNEQAEQVEQFLASGGH